MAVYVSNIVIEQGFDFDTSFQLEDTRTNALLDLTGTIAEGQIRKSSSSINKVAFAATVSSPENGLITVSLGSTITDNMKPGRYVYDVLVNSSSSTNTTNVLDTAISVGNTAGIGTTAFTFIKVTNVAVGDSVTIGDKLSEVPVVSVATTNNRITVGTAFTSSSQILPGTAVTFSRVSTASTIYRIVQGSIIVKAGISSAPS